MKNESRKESAVKIGAAKSDYVAILSVLQGHLAEYNARKAELIARKGELCDAIDALLRAPLQRADVLETWKNYIDHAGREFLKNFRVKDKFVQAAHKVRGQNEQFTPLTMRDFEAIASGDDFEIKNVVTFGGWKFFGMYTERDEFMIDGANYAAMFFFGDAMKQKIGDHFDELFPGYDVPESELGPPVVERRKQIGEMRAKLTTIDAELSEINATIEQAGVVVMGT